MNLSTVNETNNSYTAILGAILKETVINMYVLERESLGITEKNYSIHIFESVFLSDTAKTVITMYMYLKENSWELLKEIIRYTYLNECCCVILKKILDPCI